MFKLSSLTKRSIGFLFHILLKHFSLTHSVSFACIRLSDYQRSFFVLCTQKKSQCENLNEEKTKQNKTKLLCLDDRSVFSDIFVFLIENIFN
jgi:hypothetical protein